MITPSGEYQRALAVVNPNSTNAKRMSRELAELALSLPVMQIESSKTADETRDRIYTEAEAGDIVLGAGGDGLQRQIANIRLQAPADGHAFGTLTIAHLRGGYANDHATNLIGKRTAVQALKEGYEIDFHPLDIIINSPEGVQTTSRAVGDCGFGGTGEASRRIENVKTHSNAFLLKTGIQLGRKALASWVAVGHYPEFTVTSGGEQQTVSDYLFVRGDHIAKYGHPHADPTKPEFELLASAPIGMVDALGDMLKMQRGRLHGTMLDAARFVIESVGGTPIAAHEDGEFHEIASGSHVNVRISPDSYPALYAR